ncbi:MAG: hypothetical protein BM560_02515 [Roseobacter sp. MedPE-SWde]|nr:MAG: hypothetical protein BM560_02515 [Roseobacter sp. MedPE-SWde]
MNVDLNFLALSLISFGLSNGSTYAASPEIYNESCITQVGDFQQSSNEEDATITRHKLLLCLAEDSYVATNQKPSNYENWSSNDYFKIYATSTDVGIRDTQLETTSKPAIMWDPSLITGYGAVTKDSWLHCPCPETSLTRSPGDPNGPRKAEPFDVSVTFSLSEVMERGTEGFDQLQGVIDHMQRQTLVPYKLSHQAANIMAQMTTDWEAETGSLGAVEPHISVASGCACPSVRLPVKRYGGDAVPSDKYVGPGVYFRTNDFNALSGALGMGRYPIGAAIGLGSK